MDLDGVKVHKHAIKGTKRNSQVLTGIEVMTLRTPIECINVSLDETHSKIIRHRGTWPGKTEEESLTIFKLGHIGLSMANCQHTKYTASIIFINE